MPKKTTKKSTHCRRKPKSSAGQPVNSVNCVSVWGRQISQDRVRACLTHEDLAEKTGWSVRTIQRIQEDTVTTCTANTLQAICQVLGVRPDTYLVEAVPLYDKLSDEALLREFIIKQILGGKFRPEIQDLRTELVDVEKRSQYSPETVASVLGSMVHEGFVVHRENGAFQLRRLTTEELVEAYEEREEHEIRLMKKVVGNTGLRPVVLLQMSLCLERIKEALSREDVDRALSYEFGFHLAWAAGRPTLIANFDVAMTIARVFTLSHVHQHPNRRSQLATVSQMYEDLQGIHEALEQGWEADDDHLEKLDHEKALHEQELAELIHEHVRRTAAYDST